MRLRRAAAALLVAAIGLVAVAGPAAAAPVPGVPAGAKLPAGFPDDLKQYVAGTQEWSAAPWMTGACAGQGGDVGAYINAVAQVQSRLMYWSASAEQRKGIWAILKLKGRAMPPAPIEDHEPAAGDLPKGPGSDGGWSMVEYPQLCATQAAAWAAPAANAFGFSWSAKVDNTTIASLPDEQAGTVLFDNPCGSSSDAAYCAQTYYLNCDLAAGDPGACTAWNALTLQNLSVMKTFADANQSVWASLTGFLGSIGSDLWSGGKAVVDGFKSVWSAVEAVARFVGDPASAIDDLANSVKDGAVSLLQFVLGQMNQAAAWDPGQGGFLQRYAMVAAIGVVLLGFMFLGAINDAHDRGDRRGLGDLLRRMGFALGLILFAPALYALLEEGASAGSASIIDNFTSQSGGDALAKLSSIGVVTSEMVPGGVIVGLLLFLLMLLGALGLFIGLMVQRFGVEIAATLIALTAGLYVHPGWSRRVSKLNFTVIGLIAAKPVTFLVVGAAFGVIGDNLSAEQLTSSPANVLGGLTIAAVGLVFAGLAPLALLKWAPVLPIGHTAGGGGGLVTGAVIGAGLDGAVRSMQNRPAAAAAGGRMQGAGQQTGGQTGGGGGSATRSTGPNLLAALDARTARSAQTAGGGGGMRAAGGAGRAVGSSAGRGAVAGAASAGTAVATGGGSVLAQMGQAAAAKAQHAAHNHVPDGVLPDEEGRS